MKKTLSFTLDTEMDQDILAWYNSLAPRGRSQAIREALRGRFEEREITLADVYEAVLELKRSGGPLAVANDPASDDEPPDVMAALDQLGM